MYSNIGIIAILMSLIMILTLLFNFCPKKLENTTIWSVIILIILGVHLCIYDQILKNSDYAYFLEYEYDKNKPSHYKCHKDFLTLNKEFYKQVSFESFVIMRCIREQDKLQEEYEKRIIEQEKKKENAEKERLLIEQEKVKMNFQ